MIECVVNVSEGRDRAVLDSLVAAAGSDLLDLHTDADHHRSVFTLLGTGAPRQLARRAVDLLDIREHSGAHPRIGVVDVVPFVPLEGSTPEDAHRERDDFARWAADELGVPCFLYGRHGGGLRTLPQIRRQAFGELRPDTGPLHPHPSAGAMAVGARKVLVAYNVWLEDPDITLARDIATELRSEAVRTLGLRVGSEVQVSMNLIDPLRVGPSEVYDAVAARAPVARAELVGLVPRAVLEPIDPSRWAELDLAPERTIEARATASR